MKIRITLQVKKQYFPLVRTVVTEVEFKKKTCSSQRDFYLRYNARVCKTGWNPTLYIPHHGSSER
jgi:hypothetical protein